MDPTRRGWRAIPLGAATSALVLAVLVGTQVIKVPGGTASATPGRSAVVVVPPTAGPTPLQVDTEPLVVFRETANGSWELVRSRVREVCKQSKPRCVPKPEEQIQAIDLGNRPKKITMSPTDNHLVIAASSESGADGAVLVVPVEPGGSPEPGASPLPTVIITEPPGTEAPDGSSAPSPAATPPGAIAIATGVTVVGDVAYSADGDWLAFSAAPSDGSTGPDLYLWSVGEPSATVVTDDHQTYFSSWHDGQVLASRVDIEEASVDPGASGEPAAPGETTALPEPTRKPGRGNNDNGPTPAETEPPAASADPDASATPAPPIVGRPTSFLLDPATLERRDLTTPDVWLPVLGPSGSLVVYWSGTLESADGRDWALGDGELVLDGWIGLPDTERLGDPQENDGAEPDATPTPVGPEGRPTPLVDGSKAAFEASFDPEGGHLAIWVGEHPGEEVGRLHLLVVDPETGVVAGDPPLQGARALRRFSIDTGRLAWVTPSGQDGHESAVQVLGWTDDDFGEIETQSGSDLYIAP
jgi:hypothetical protein